MILSRAEFSSPTQTATWKNSLRVRTQFKLVDRALSEWQVHDVNAILTNKKLIQTAALTTPPSKLSPRSWKGACCMRFLLRVKTSFLSCTSNPLTSKQHAFRASAPKHFGLLYP